MIDAEIEKIVETVRDTLGIDKNDLDFKRLVGAQIVQHLCQQRTLAQMMEAVQLLVGANRLAPPTPATALSSGGATPVASSPPPALTPPSNVSNPAPITYTPISASISGTVTQPIINLQNPPPMLPTPPTPAPIINPNKLPEPETDVWFLRKLDGRPLIEDS